MLRIGTVVVGVDDMARAAGFWTRALGYVPRDGEVEEVVLADTEGNRFCVIETNGHP